MNVEKGEPTLNYNHHFKFAPLKAYANAKTYDTLWGPTNFQNTHYSYIKNKTFSNQRSDDERATLTIVYDTAIQKACFSKHPLMNQMAPYSPAQIHFGVLPVQSNTPLAPTPTWAAVCCIWEIE